MRTLIIATNATPARLPEEIQAGTHNRVDYLELSRRPDTTYVDYNIVKKNSLATLLEETLRTDFRQAWNVAQLVKREGYEQVFSMSERVGIPLALLLDRRVRHVVQLAHGLSTVKLWLIRLLAIPRRWDVIIAPTRAEERVLKQRLWVTDDRIQMLHYPVDTQFYKPQAPTENNSHGDHFESLGLSYRDYPTLIRAMRTLPGVHAYIRGGSTWVHGSMHIEGEKLPENIDLKPFVPPRELRHCYAASRFIVVPIRHTTQWSAGCTAVSQAQAMGRAVIATATPGMADYLKNGETGLLVEQSNPSAMADAIRTLWENPQQAEEMGCRAREWAHANFSIDRWLVEVQKILHLA